MVEVGVERGSILVQCLVQRHMAQNYAQLLVTRLNELLGGVDMHPLQAPIQHKHQGREPLHQMAGGERGERQEGRGERVERGEMGKERWERREEEW